MAIELKKIIPGDGAQESADKIYNNDTLVAAEAQNAKQKAIDAVQEAGEAKQIAGDKADKIDDSGNKAVYLFSLGGDDITDLVKTNIVSGKGIRVDGTIFDWEAGTNVQMYKLKPNTYYRISGMKNPQTNTPIAYLYTYNALGIPAAKTIPYIEDGGTFKTNETAIYISFIVKISGASSDINFDSLNTFRLYEGDSEAIKSLKSVSGDPIISDIDALVLNRGSNNSIEDLTEYIKGFIQTGFLINKTNGVLNYNANASNIYCVVFAKLEPNRTYSLSGLSLTQNLLREPILSFYETNDIGSSSRAYALDVIAKDEEIVFTTDSVHIYLSFYIANPSNLWNWGFDSRDSILFLENSVDSEAILDSTGKPIIPRYDSLLYKKATYEHSDRTEYLKGFIKGHGNYVIDKNNGVVKSSTWKNATVLAFVKLKPNARYALKGLALSSSMLKEPVLSFYPNNIIGTTARAYSLDVKESGQTISFQTDGENIYLSFYIEASNTGTPNWDFDSRETIEFIEYAPNYYIVDKYGQTITASKSEVSSSLYSIPSADKDTPKHVCRIDMDGDLSGISKDNAKRVTFKFNNFRGWTVEGFADLSYQGATSIRYPKKNFAFDLFDKKGKSMDMKIGTWVSMDSYHLKANYIDATHARNIACSRLLEQTCLTRPFEEQRPWRRYFDAPDNDILKRYDSGAMGHVDGFPVELYLNGEYHGLYTFNIKKNRANYQMNKSNNKHIHLEMSAQARIQSPVNWSAWEIRNPKGFTELAEPPVGEVKTAIESFFSWASRATINTTKEEFAEWIHVPAWIDYRILMLVMDNADLNVRNSQLCTWDGQHWALLLYDLDMAFGMSWEGFPWRDPNSDTDTYENGQQIVKTFASVYSQDIQKRYAYLRSGGVLTVNNIVKLFNDFMLTIGVDSYKKDYEKWTEIPSNRLDGNYPNLPNTGGYFVSVDSVKYWVAKRFEYLDPIMGY